MNNNELLLGVDPGSSKTGVALLTVGGEIKKTDVLLMTDFTGALEEFLGQQAVSLCIMGNGTTSSSMKAVLHKLLPSAEIVVIDEAHSTEEARALYWQLIHPRDCANYSPWGCRCLL